MSNSIRLHKEHSLNPTLCTCFYCGKETGEIALLGASYGGEAPMHMCTSLEPCKECKEKYKDYVLLVEATATQEDAWSPKIAQPQPTGRWLAIKKEFIKIENKGVCYVSPDDFEEILSKRGG